MRFLLLKIVGILAILVLLCLPFFPMRFKFSLASPGYDKKDRWRNICFVIEVLCIATVLLWVTPYIKNAFNWFFDLGFMRWLVDLIPDRLVYGIDIIVLIATNIGICLVILMLKNILRAILDDRVFKNYVPSSSAKKKKKKKNKNAEEKAKKHAMEKRLKQLRRESVLVFRNHKKTAEKTPVVSDYKAANKQTDPKAKAKKKGSGDGDESITLGEFIKLVWFKFIGLFYSEADDFEYVKTGTYRWAKILKNFVFLVSCMYLLVCTLMLLPIFFSFDWFPKFYSIAKWLVDNTYMYPLISLIFLFELLWFIDGEHKAPEEAEAPFVTFIDGIKEGKKADLVRARNAILDKYGQSYSIKNFDSDRMGGKSTYNLSEKKKAIQNMAKAIRASKNNLNGDYMQSIEYMLDGKHVLFDSSLYSSLGEYIIHYLFVTLSFGTRVLFICKDKKEIENAAAYLENGFQQITKTPQILWRICNFRQMHEGEKPDILLLTPEQFLERSLFVDGKEFFDELVDVFVLDADKILTANNYYCLIMAKKLEKATTACGEHGFDPDKIVAVDKRIRYSFFSNGYKQSLGNSLRQFFNIEDAPLETFHSFGLAAKTEVFVWHTGMSSTLYVDNGANQVSLELQIAKDACNFGVSDINLISETAIYGSQINEIPGLTLNNCNISDNPIGYVIVADDYFNLPNAIYNYSRFSGCKASVLHVVSKPYLLRDYFTAKAEDYVAHFELIGETMCEHADAKKANIIILLCDAVNGIEREEFIKRASSLLGDNVSKGRCECDHEEYDLQQCVKLCLDAAFECEIDYDLQHNLITEMNSELENKTFVTLNESSSLFEKLIESTKTVSLEYINTQSTEHISVFKDEITQHFIPGQILVRNNRTYTIKDMDVESGRLVLDDTNQSLNVPMDYIQTRLYSIKNAEIYDVFGHDYRSKKSYVSHVGFTLYNVNAVVDTVGYFSIEKATQTIDLVKPNFAKYVNLSHNAELLSKIRRDIQTKMLVVELDIAEKCDPRVSYTLAVILQEFMKTVFPDQYRCISVCPLLDGDDSFLEEETAIRDLYPRLIEMPNAAEVDKAEAKNGDANENHAGGKIKFAIIEDISGGNGVVDTLVDGKGIMVTNLLHVVADFLAWSISASGQGLNYLNFGNDTCPAVFDMEKLEEVVRQFRHDVARSEMVRFYDDNTCFFCHKQLEADEGETLEDGRIICEDCKESSLGSFEELYGAFDSVIDAIKKNTSVSDTFPDKISVDFVSTEEIRTRYSNENEDKIPIAYCDHINNCIYVEYGLPRASACGVMARMITELWQDINLTNDGSAIYAGQLDLVELQVLSALRFNNESDLLAKYYEGHEGLEELKKALHEIGNQDSFAYFLNSSGKKNNIDPGVVDEDEDDITFISERDPKSLPRFLYQRLNDDEKAVYDQICDAIHNYAEETGPLVREISSSACIDLLYAVIYDNPDIFWCAHMPGVVSKDNNGIAKNVIFKYVMTPSEVKRRKKQIEKAVKPFIKGIKKSMSDYEVALLAHENIVELIDYDSIGLDIQERDPDSESKPDNLRSIYGVFVEEKAVCAGYARAFQYLMSRLGIECAYVRGECHGGGWHAWNLIKLEGEYYYVDVTHDDSSNTDVRKNSDSEVSHDYFCITTAELLRSRNIEKAEIYPDCTATKCNYFVRSRLFFKEYDASNINKIVASAIKVGKKELALKAENASVMAVIKKRLVTDGGVFDIIRSLDGKKLPKSYSYYINEDLNILHIFFVK